MVQSPLLPVTWTVSDSLAVIGVARGPTVVGVGRVSNNRHGVIGTKVDDVGPVAAWPM